MNKVMCSILAVSVCAAANAATYYAKVTSSAAIPGCLTFYSDEACTAPASVTPTANDGNTYVIKSHANSDYNKINASTVPAGTTWIIGTSTTRPTFCTNGSATYDLGSCTINGVLARNNGDGLSKLAGSYTFANSNNAIEFSPVNNNNGKARGFNLIGTFTSADDTVLVKFGTAGWSTLASEYVLSGTFSGYKGKFLVQAIGTTTLSLTSASAFGDPSVTMDDYLTVKKNVTLSIDPAVTQYATKGITFSLGADETAYIDVASGKDLTLIAPIGGSSGTFAKTGAGTLTLATSVEITSLSVDAGTLIVDSAASFAAGSTMKVKSGATVVSRVGSSIPNVTLNIEDGGSFTYDFTIPFNGTTVTTMDYTSLTAADRTLLTKPIPITLSQMIALPQNTAMNLAVARFSASAGFEAADFTDGTAKTYGLPRTSFAMSEPDNGIVTLTMAVRPAVTRTGGNRFVPLDAQYTYASGAYTSTPVWSDGQVAHPDADYALALTGSGVETYTYNSWDTNVREFNGGSLYLTTQISVKSKELVLPETTFAGGSVYDVNGSPATHTYSGGPYILASDVMFRGNAENSSFIRYSLDAAVRGVGTLTLTCVGLDTRASYVKGDNSQLKGKVVVTHQGTPSGVSESARLEVALGSSLGGAMDAFTTDGIKITKYSIVRPQQTMALNAVNRGVTIDGYGGFDVGEGMVLTIANPVALTGESGSLIKMGAGTILLDGGVSCEGANTVAVDGGRLRAPSASGGKFDGATVAFAAGTGLEIDVENVFSNGVEVAVITFADAKLAVRFANTEAMSAEGRTRRIPICTVPSSSSLTEDSFAYAKPCRGFAAKVEQEVLGDGSLRFVARCNKLGFVLSLR